MKQSNPKTRQFSIVCYCQPQRVAELFTTIRHYACIKHDKDRYEIGENIGELKQEHYHLIVVLENPRYYLAVRKMLAEASKEYGLGTILVEAVVELHSMYEYILHQDPLSVNNEYKATYDIDDVMCDDVVFWDTVLNGKKTETSNKQFLIDLITLPSMAMAIKYGRDYIRNYSKYTDFAYTVISSFDGDKQAVLDTIDVVEAINEANTCILDGLGGM